MLLSAYYETDAVLVLGLSSQQSKILTQWIYSVSSADEGWEKKKKRKVNPGVSRVMRRLLSTGWSGKTLWKTHSATYKSDILHESCCFKVIRWAQTNGNKGHTECREQLFRGGFVYKEEQKMEGRDFGVLAYYSYLFPFKKAKNNMCCSLELFDKKQKNHEERKHLLEQCPWLDQRTGP